MLYAVESPIRLLITANKNEITYTLISDQVAVTHRSITIKTSHELISELNNRFAKMVNENLPLNDFIGRGKVMYQQLVPSEVAEELEKRTSDYVMLSIQDSSIPWEFMHDGTDFWGKKYFIGRSLLSRGESVKDENLNGTRRALLIVNPTCDLPDAEIEGKAVMELFRSQGIYCDYISRSLATLGNVLNRLNDYQYDFIHFCGHADSEGESALILNGDVKFPASAILRSKAKAQCIFLNGCQTAAADAQEDELKDLVNAFARNGAKAVVGPLYPISDVSAKEFSLRFFEKVLSGTPIGMALSEIRSCFSSEEGPKTWLSFVLYGNPALCYVPYPIAPVLAGEFRKSLSDDCIELLYLSYKNAITSNYITSTHIYYSMFEQGIYNFAILKNNNVDLEKAKEKLRIAEKSEEYSLKSLSPGLISTFQKLYERFLSTKRRIHLKDLAEAIWEDKSSAVRVLFSEEEKWYDGLSEKTVNGLKLANFFAKKVYSNVNSYFYLLAMASQNNTLLNYLLIEFNYGFPENYPTDEEINKIIENEGVPPLKNVSENLKNVLQDALKNKKKRYIHSVYFT